MTAFAFVPDFVCPTEEAEELAALLPYEREHGGCADAFSVLASVSFHAPAEIRAAPRAQTRAACGVPQELDGSDHMFEFTLRLRAYWM